MSFRESTLQWVDKMLLCDMIRLRDVPKEIRTAAGGVYITALRISNSVSVRRFVQDLIVLAQDIYTMPEDNPIRPVLLRHLYDYLSINNYKGEEVLESFRNDLYPEVLQELQRCEKAVGEMLRDFNRKSENDNCYWQDQPLTTKIIIDRSKLKSPHGFKFGERGVSGKIVNGKFFKYKTLKGR